MADLAQAWLDCRKSKRNKATALTFERDVERNLCALRDELIAGTYRPGRTICFVNLRPKPREVWAAKFDDRVVHHLLYNYIRDRFHARFIANSCACIPERGTLYAVNRLEHAVRSVTQNWSRPAHYLKLDLSNFFVAIKKQPLFEQISKLVTESFWRDLAGIILFHDPRTDVELRGSAERLALVPPHKSLFNAPDDTGLPIGNLSSQFFANIYLDALDQFCKHQLKAKHYVRYVDDFVILHESPQWLNEALKRITEFLPAKLGAHLNPKITIFSDKQASMRAGAASVAINCQLRMAQTVASDEYIAVGPQRKKALHLVRNGGLKLGKPRDPSGDNCNQFSAARAALY